MELLFNGDQTFDCLLAELSRAETLITWHVFWFKPGHLADRVSEVLRERARAGVTVLMLFDTFGSQGLSDAYRDRLRGDGVEVARFRPLTPRTLYKAQQRMHIRAVVVDGRVGFTGGFGVDDHWKGNGRKPGEWRDTNVRFTGPAVAQLQGAFAANWAEATGQLIAGTEAFAFDESEAPARAGIDDDGSVLAGMLFSAPSFGSTPAERFLYASLAAARERFYITAPYFVADRHLRRALCRASDRGVDVRVLTPGRNTDRPSTYHAARAHYEELIRGGLRIYEYRPTMIHAKTLIVDGRWWAVGTMNLDNRSLKLNDEVALVGTDLRVAGRLERCFLEDLRYSDEVSLDALAERPWSDRLLEAGAVLISRLL